MPSAYREFLDRQTVTISDDSPPTVTRRVIDASDLLTSILRMLFIEDALTLCAVVPLVSKAFGEAQRRCLKDHRSEAAGDHGCNFLMRLNSRREFCACGSLLLARERRLGCARAWIDGFDEPAVRTAAVRAAHSWRTASHGSCAGGMSWSSTWGAWLWRPLSATLAPVNAMLDALAPRRFSVLLTGTRGAGKTAVLAALHRGLIPPPQAIAGLDPIRLQFAGAELVVDELPIVFGPRAEEPEVKQPPGPRLQMHGVDPQTAERYVAWMQYDAVVYVSTAAARAPDEGVEEAVTNGVSEPCDARALAKLLGMRELQDAPLLVLVAKQDDEAQYAKAAHRHSAATPPPPRRLPTLSSLLLLPMHASTRAHRSAPPSRLLGALGLVDASRRTWRLQGCSTSGSGIGAGGPSAGVVEGFEWLVARMRTIGAESRSGFGLT